MHHDRLLLLRRLTLRLKRVPGAVLALEPLRKYFAKHPDCVEVRDYDGSSTARLCLHEHMQSQMFWYGYYSRDIIMVLERLLREGMTCVDAGANVGEITMAMARRVGSTGAVYSFEPMAEIFSRLIEHVEANEFSNVTCERAGLSHHEGEAPIFAATENFLDGSEHRGLGTLFSSPSRARPVEVISLLTWDAYARVHGIEHLDVLKIDVEGSELPALQGAAKSIAKSFPAVIVEVQAETARQAGYEPSEILNFLDGMGYCFYTIGRKGSLAPLEAKALKAFQNVLCLVPGRFPHFDV